MLMKLIKHKTWNIGQSESQCQSEYNFIIVGADGAVSTGLHYKNTRLYANHITVMVRDAASKDNF